jgi:hypothetical protein
MTAINVTNYSLTPSSIVTLVRFELGSPQQEKRVLTTRPAGRQGSSHYAISLFWNFLQFHPTIRNKSKKIYENGKQEEKTASKGPKNTVHIISAKKHGHAKVHDADV